MALTVVMAPAAADSATVALLVQPFELGLPEAEVEEDCG